MAEFDDVGVGGGSRTCPVVFVVFVGDGCAVVDEHIRGVRGLRIVVSEHVAGDGDAVGAGIGWDQ